MSEKQKESPLEDERWRRVSQILAGGLVRLNSRGTLAIENGNGQRHGENSLSIPGDSPESRLESPAESGLTVHDG